MRYIGLNKGVTLYYCLLGIGFFPIGAKKLLRQNKKIFDFYRVYLLCNTLKSLDPIILQHLM